MMIAACFGALQTPLAARQMSTAARATPLQMAAIESIKVSRRLPRRRTAACDR
jgi:hypothetical protein